MTAKKMADVFFGNFSVISVTDSCKIFTPGNISCWYSVPTRIIVVLFSSAESMSEIKQINSNSVQGNRHSNAWAINQQLYYHLEFSEDIKEIVYREDSLVAGFKFGVLEKPLLVRVGISAVSKNNAKKNLQDEIDHWDFQKTLKKSINKWEEVLGKIKIETSNEVQPTICTSGYI